MRRWGVLLLGFITTVLVATGQIIPVEVINYNQFVHGYSRYCQSLELPQETDYPRWEPGESICPLRASEAIDLAEHAATNLIDGLTVDHQHRYVSLIKRDDYWFYEVKLGLVATNGTPKARSVPICIAVGIDGNVPEFEVRENKTRRFGGGFRRADGASSGSLSVADEMSEEEKEKKREEVRERLRQAQMELIRSGMPPMPIPLTHEMDDQLVAEGFLPPLDTTDQLSHPPLNDGWTNSIPNKRPKSGITKD